MPPYLPACPEIGNTNQWARHIDGPFSPEALGDPDKPYTTVEGLSFPDNICRLDLPDLDWNVGTDKLVVKGWDEERIGLNCLSNVCANRIKGEDCDEPDLTSPLHIAFEGIAIQILGERAYSRSTIDLTLWRKAIRRGNGQVTMWHLDTLLHSLVDTPKDEFGLMGLISDVLPAQVLLNPTHPEDYSYGNLQSVMGVPLDRAKLRMRTLRPNTLYVLPLSMPHRSQVADSNIPRRHFMRWQLSD